MSGVTGGRSFLTYVAYHGDHVLELTLEHVAITAITVVITGVLGVGIGAAVYRADRPRRIRWRSRRCT